MTRKRFALLMSCVVAAFGSSAAPAFGQASDAALKDRVSQLVEKLGNAKAETAKSAEEALIKLGPRVLSLLPESVKGERRRSPRLVSKSALAP